MTTHIFTPQQEAVFDNVTGPSTRNTLVVARAGCAKTTVLVEAARRLSEEKPSLSAVALVFGKDNAATLRARFELSKTKVPASTFHSLGFKALTEVLGCVSLSDEMKDELESLKIPKKEWYNTRRAVSLAKNMLLSDLDSIIHAQDEAGLEYEGDGYNQARNVLRLLELSKDLSQREKVTNDDLIWLPVVLDLDLPKYDMLLIDELQDSCRVQFEMLKRIANPGARAIGVADPCQAIFSFRGADKRAVLTFKQFWNPEMLPLSVSFRCARSIIREAQKFALDIQAREDAPEGTVRSGTPTTLLEEVEYGDYVLSRTNAPLVKVALRLLSQECRVSFAGREGLGEGLLSLLKTFGRDASTPGEILRNAQSWLIRKRSRLPLDAKEQRDLLDDKLACLTALLTGPKTNEEAFARARSVFSAGPANACVTLSTIHRAKGAERDRVFLLKDTLRNYNEEERNIEYVGITRARNELVYVKGKI